MASSTITCDMAVDTSEMAVIWGGRLPEICTIKSRKRNKLAPTASAANMFLPFTPIVVAITPTLTASPIVASNAP
ncbi:hypothetical protein [Sphingorhabdus sp.]|uniref:hypothetical protein n=1 Tax=Sphingorhabdus sp. TaxID=1902408 RepID=UPI003783A2F4